MVFLTLILLTLIILFISTLARSTFGFGDALIAMPLLSLVMGVHTAAPIVVLVSVTIAITIVGGEWYKIDIKAAWRLIIASVLGIPLGLLLLKTAPEGIMKGILGIVLILFGVYNLTKPILFTLNQPRWAYGFGFIAGILGGAYNANGPPIVIYGTLRRWSPTRFRATLQAFFMISGIFLLLGHALGGLWTAQVLQLYALSLPIVFIAIFLGGKLNQRISTHRFERFLYISLIILGILLLL